MAHNLKELLLTEPRLVLPIIDALSNMKISDAFLVSFDVGIVEDMSVIFEIW
jgi:hypothetical protein